MGCPRLQMRKKPQPIIMPYPGSPQKVQRQCWGITRSPLPTQVASPQPTGTLDCPHLLYPREALVLALVADPATG